MQKYLKDVEDWKSRWPNYCPDCNGWGGAAERYDPSPTGVALSPGYFYEFEPCPSCTSKNNCGRCGDHLQFDDPDDRTHVVCRNCGWSPGDDGIHEGPECFCWIEEEVPNHES